MFFRASTLTLFLLPLVALAQDNNNSGNNDDSDCSTSYNDQRGGAGAGLAAGTLLDSSNGGKLLNGNLLNLDSSLIEGPLLKRCDTSYKDQRGGAGAGLLAGTLVDSSNGGEALNGDLVNVSEPLIKGPLLGKRQEETTYNDQRGGPGAGLLAGTLLDSSNGGEMLNGDLVNVDKSLIKGPIIKREDETTYNDQRGAPGAGLLAGTLVDSSNGGQALNGNLLNVDKSLIDGPLIKRTDETTYNDQRGAPGAGLLAGTLLDSSNGGQMLNGNLLNVDKSLVDGPIIKRTDETTYNDQRGGPGAGLLAGTLLDSSNGGQMLNGNLVNADQPLVKGPILKREHAKRALQERRLPSQH